MDKSFASRWPNARALPLEAKWRGSTFPVTLADGQNWMRPYTFQINDTDLWKVQFLLFKDGDFSSAYRERSRPVR